MRMFRLIAAVTALVMAASLSVLAASSATAAAPSQSFSKATSSTQAVDARAARRPHAMKSVRAEEIRNTGRFVALGKISTLRGKKIYLQKARNRNAPFNRFKVGRTNGVGKFRITFDGPVGTCYRVVAPPTPRAKTNSKVVGCIISA